MRIPKLPIGHTWSTERIFYEGSRTLLIVWNHPAGYHVDHRAVKPRWYWFGYWMCYFGGLARIRDDKKWARRKAREDRYVKAAEALAD